VQKLNKINEKRVLEFHLQCDIILNKNGKVISITLVITSLELSQHADVCCHTMYKIFFIRNPTRT
jgi:hypothetical protein